VRNIQKYIYINRPTLVYITATRLVVWKCWDLKYQNFNYKRWLKCWSWR